MKTFSRIFKKKKENKLNDEKDLTTSIVIDLINKMVNGYVELINTSEHESYYDARHHMIRALMELTASLRNTFEEHSSRYKEHDSLHQKIVSLLMKYSNYEEKVKILARNEGKEE